MYGEAKIAADVLLTAPTAFVTPAAGQMRFHVEEAEMWVELAFLGTIEHSAGAVVFGTFYVDSADVGDLADGLYENTLAATTATACFFGKKMRLAQGEHLLEVRFKSATGNVTVDGAGVPCVLSALRLSHNATNAANANNKQSGGIY